MHRIPRRFMELCFALLPVMGIAAEAPQTAPRIGEQLFVLPPKDWTIGFHNRRGPVDLTELIPPNQTIQEWEEMLIIQMIDGKPEKSPQDLLRDQYSEEQQACEDIGAGPVSPGVDNGYDIAMRVITCTKSKRWNKGEVTLYKVIRGHERTYIVSRAWRGDPFSKDKPPLSIETTKSWLDFMRQVKVCDTRDAQRPCPLASAKSAPPQEPPAPPPAQ